MTALQLYNTYTLADLLALRAQLWEDLDARGHIKDRELYFKVTIAINWHRNTAKPPRAER